MVKYNTFYNIPAYFRSWQPARREKIERAGGESNDWIGAKLFSSLMRKTQIIFMKVKICKQQRATTKEEGPKDFNGLEYSKGEKNTRRNHKPESHSNFISHSGAKES